MRFFFFLRVEFCAYHVYIMQDTLTVKGNAGSSPCRCVLCVSVQSMSTWRMADRHTIAPADFTHAQILTMETR